MSQPFSPSRRETKIPTPTSSRGGSPRSKSSTSPISRKYRSPQGSGKKGPRSPENMPRRPNRQPRPLPKTTDAAGCVSVSMDMLQTSMKQNADAYECLSNGNGTETADDAAMRQPNDGKNTPWMSVINKLYQKHSEETNQLKHSLKTAKQKSRHYKEELRENLTERLKFLESKVLEHQDTETSRAESSTTNTTQEGTSASEGTLTQQQRPGTVEPGTVEVVYEAMSDKSMKKRVEQLELRLQQSNLAHTFEKEHWLQTLEEAAKANSQGEHLSSQVQGILEQVALDWEDIHREELVTATEAKEHLEQRLKEMEQAHQKERAQWQHESSKLKDDSRRLLRERNDYKSKLTRHKQELEKSQATLTELERKVDLCQRKTSLAEKKATQMEEKASNNQRAGQQRQDPPSPVRPESLEHQLKRAMQERDAALKEAEETCKMLEDYQNRLESDRKSYNTKLKHAEEKYERDLDRRMTEYKNELVEQYQKCPLSELPHAELERRYQDSVEKRNELASRMKQLQEQLSSEKGNWKLKLEGTMSDNRRLLKEKENLKAQNENLRAQNENLDSQIKALASEQKSARVNWENRLEQASKEWVERLSEIQEEHQREKDELNESLKNLKEYKENAETLASETRKQLDKLQEKHKQDIIEWKEREVQTSQKTLFDAKEDFAAEMKALHQEIARLEKEGAALEKNLQEEKENSEQLQNDYDKVTTEWEQHSMKLQEEKERLETELKAANEQISEIGSLLSEWEQQGANLEEEKQRLESKLQAANKKANEMEQALDEVLDEHEEASAAKRGLEEQHQLEKDEWQKHRDDLEARISELQKVVEKRELDTRNLEETNDDLEKRANRLSDNRDALAKEVLEWKDKLIKAGLERDAALAEAKTATERLLKVQAWEAVTAERESALSQLRKQNNDLNEICESHSAELDVWKRKSERLEAELKRAVESRAEDSRQAVERIEALEEENAELRQFRDEKSAQDESSLKQKYYDLLEEKTRLVDLNEKQRQELREWSSKFEHLEASWVKRIEQLQHELANVETAKDDQKREAMRLQETLDDERGTWERGMEDLKTQNAKLARPKEDLTTKLKEMETHMNKLKNLYEGKCRDAEATKHEKDEQIYDLRNQLSNLEQSMGLSARGVAEMKALHAGEVQELREQLESLRRDCDSRVAQGREELDGWKERAESAKDEFQRQLERTRSDHESESKALRDKLARADEDIASFAGQTTKLTASLDQLQRAHEDAKRHLQAEINRLRSENERLQSLLRSHQERQEHQTVWRTQTSSLQQHQHSISSLVEGIRSDVQSVRNLVQTSIEQRKMGDMGTPVSSRADLETIRGSLEATLSKMNQETEALLDHRNQIKALTEASARADDAHQRFSEQQERLISEMQSLRDQVSDSVGRGTDDSAILDKVRLELVEELHRKETELARRRAELNHLQDELMHERALREKAEKEILTLNDQADAYGEELMRLQGLNKTLEESLHDFDDNMIDPGMGRKVALPGNADDRSMDSNASSPMLDEALALAQSLTDLVHGSGSDKQETSVMAMLENISEMMDQQDRGNALKTRKLRRTNGVPTQVSVSRRCQRALNTRVEEDQSDGHLETVLFPNEDEPLPVSSPPNQRYAEENSSHLHVVVNELYTRCHLLERERTQMMESTLELLHAARDANEAELEAALSTARRKSAEELLKVQEESQRGMWRMYNKLCSFCRDDVAAIEDEKKEIM